MAEISGGRGYRRLNSWKEIASFFGKDERTVKRWEAARGLPVRRVPGGNRTTVFAYAEELEAWLNGEGKKPNAPASPAPAVPQKRPSVLAWLVPLLLALGIGGALVYVNTLPNGPVASRHTPDPMAQELYLSATYDLNTRTGDGIRRSIDTFGQAIARDAAYAEAYAGLATAYNLVSQYTMAPPAESYAAGRQAAEQAIALEPGLAAAHAALGFNLFNDGHDFAGSAAEFERALALDPNDAQAMHWYALTSMQLGRFERPLELMARAQQLQPTSRPIRANRALIMFHAGQVEGALGILEGMRQEFPDYLATPSYLATIYLDQRRYPEFLKAYEEAARVENNAARLGIAAAARQGFEQGGEAGLLRAMYAAQEAGQEPAYKVATTAAMLGETQQALDWLDRSHAAHEDELWGVRIDPAFRGLYRNGVFRGLLTELGFPLP